MGAVADQVSLTGSYNSALEPPVTSTFPFGNKVAVLELRLVAVEPVFLHLPMTGSNISVANGVPPIASTRPLVKRIALWPDRFVFSDPVSVHNAPSHS